MQVTGKYPLCHSEVRQDCLCKLLISLAAALDILGLPRESSCKYAVNHGASPQTRASSPDICRGLDISSFFGCKQHDYLLR